MESEMTLGDAFGMQIKVVVGQEGIVFSVVKHH